LKVVVDVDVLGGRVGTASATTGFDRRGEVSGNLNLGMARRRR